MYPCEALPTASMQMLESIPSRHNRCAAPFRKDFRHLTWSRARSGAPEEEMMRSAGNFRDAIFLSLAYCNNWVKMAGAPNSNVIRSFSSVTRASSGRSAVTHIACACDQRTQKHNREADSMRHRQDAVEPVFGRQGPHFGRYRRHE